MEKTYSFIHHRMIRTIKRNQIFQKRMIPNPQRKVHKFHNFMLMHMATTYCCAAFFIPLFLIVLPVSLLGKNPSGNAEIVFVFSIFTGVISLLFDIVKMGIGFAVRLISRIFISGVKADQVRLFVYYAMNIALMFFAAAWYASTTANYPVHNHHHNLSIKIAFQYIGLYFVFWHVIGIFVISIITKITRRFSRSGH